jgi:EpsD family peptidyl-prolyl cis-trans isomerase
MGEPVQSQKAMAWRDRRSSAVRIVAVCAALAGVGLVAACGDKKDKPATQVAAQVNSREISVHQINFLLQHQRGLQPEQVGPASRQALEHLIDQELAVQKAMEGKLDREPRVLQALEATRREVLARAYLEQQAEGMAKPSPQEIEKYYGDKAALFKNRRVYTFDEFAIQAPAESLAAVQAALQNSKTTHAFADALKAAKLPFGVSSQSLLAENIPLDLLDKVSAMNEGQALLLAQPGGARALVLRRIAAAPVSLEQARPAIEQFLTNDAKRRKVEAETKALRLGATVKYVGMFAEPAASAVASPGVAASQSAALPLSNATLAAPAPTPTTSGTVNTDVDADAVRRGIKGLK